MKSKDYLLDLPKANYIIIPANYTTRDIRASGKRQKD